MYLATRLLLLLNSMWFSRSIVAYECFREALPPQTGPGEGNIFPLLNSVECSSLSSAVCLYNN